MGEHGEVSGGGEVAAVRAADVLPDEVEKLDERLSCANIEGGTIEAETAE